MSIPVTEVKGAMDRILADRDRPWKVTVDKDVDFGSSQAITMPTPSQGARTLEVRTVSATGGQKGVKPEQYDQIPVNAEAELARHFGYGAKKYAAHNFRQGYEWSKNYNALRRHLAAFWGGQDYDLHEPDCPADCTNHLPDSKHIIAVAWHAMVLATFMDEHPEYDDRYKALNA